MHDVEFHSHIVHPKQCLLAPQHHRSEDLNAGVSLLGHLVCKWPLGSCMQLDRSWGNQRKLEPFL